MNRTTTCDDESSSFKFNLSVRQVVANNGAFGEAVELSFGIDEAVP